MPTFLRNLNLKLHYPSIYHTFLCLPKPEWENANLSYNNNSSWYTATHQKVHNPPNSLQNSHADKKLLLLGNQLCSDATHVLKKGH